MDECAPQRFQKDRSSKDSPDPYAPAAKPLYVSGFSVDFTGMKPIIENKRACF